MLNPIRIVFQRIAETLDAAAYINARLDLLLHAYEDREAFREQPNREHILSEAHRAALVRLVADSQFSEPQLDSTRFHPVMDDNQQLIADQRVDCAIDTIRTVNPLLPEECLKSQVQSYLKESYLGFTPRTGVIHQVTDMADVYFFFLDCHVENKGDVIWVPPRDRQQKALFAAAIDHLPGSDGKNLLQEKLNQGLKYLIPVPYNSLVVMSESK